VIAEEVLEQVECLVELDVNTQLFVVLRLHEVEELELLSEEDVLEILDLPKRPSEVVLRGGKLADLCVEAYAHKLVHHRRLSDVRHSVELVHKAHHLDDRIVDEVGLLHPVGRERVEERLYDTQAGV